MMDGFAFNESKKQRTTGSTSGTASSSGTAISTATLLHQTQANAAYAAATQEMLSRAAAMQGTPQAVNTNVNPLAAMGAGGVGVGGYANQAMNLMPGAGMIVPPASFGSMNMNSMNMNSMNMNSMNMNSMNMNSMNMNSMNMNMNMNMPLNGIGGLNWPSVGGVGLPASLQLGTLNHHINNMNAATGTSSATGNQDGARLSNMNNLAAASQLEQHIPRVFATTGTQDNAVSNKGDTAITTLPEEQQTYTPDTANPSNNGSLNAKRKRSSACTQDEKWTRMFEKLQQYKAEYNDCLVPFDHKDDPQLGWWVHWQRRNKSGLTHERLQMLDGLEFIWKVRNKERWEDILERFRAYTQEKGNCLVPQRFKEDPKLGKWVHYQRAMQHQLCDSRKADLDAVGFVWCVQGPSGKGKNKKQSSPQA